MATATKPKTEKPKTVELIEQSFNQVGLTLAEEEGQPVLRHVKILGSVSQNGRFYTPEAKAAAVPLYESVKVNLDHPENPSKTRSLRDRFGKLIHIRLENGDLYGDLLFNPHHELAESVKWYAKNMPECLGLSHNAVGQGEERDGKFIVNKIAKLRSVDLVADPATTVTLFESIQEEVTEGTSLSEGVVKKAPTDSDAKVGTNEKPPETSPTPPPTEVPGPNNTIVDSPIPEPSNGEGWDEFDKSVGQLVRKLIQNKQLTKEQKRKSLLTACKLMDEEVKEVKKEKKEGETTEAPESIQPVQGTLRGPTNIGVTKVADTTPTSTSTKTPQQLLESILADTRKKHSELTTKVSQYEKQDQKEVNVKKARVLLQESKLPNEAVTAHFLDKLTNASSEKEMRDLIEDRKLLLTPGQVNLTEAVGARPTPTPKPAASKTPPSDAAIASLLRGTPKVGSFAS